MATLPTSRESGQTSNSGALTRENLTNHTICTVSLVTV